MLFTHKVRSEKNSESPNVAVAVATATSSSLNVALKEPTMSDLVGSQQDSQKTE